MLNDDIMNYALSNAYKRSTIPKEKTSTKQDISEQEALQIFNEIVELLASHEVSYSCACRISIALTDAFINGAVEMYNRENP